MYRTLGTRGSVFGVPTGPYAGEERVVLFARLPDACKRRFVAALSGTGALTPILRPGPSRRSLRVLFCALLVVGLYGLFAARWPSRQGFVFAAYDVVVAVVLAWTVRGARRALSFEGTVVLAGTYLFPLDVVEATLGGVLHVIPLGKVREAAVAIVASRPSLVLAFADGKTRAFGVNSAKEAEAAFAAMETAQKTLEKLTYDRDLEAAVHLDPFFEVRMDGSWESAAPASKSRDRASAAVALGLGALLGLSVFGVRHLLGVRADRIASERTMERGRAELVRHEEQNVPRPTKDIAHKPDTQLLPGERSAREEQRRRALDAFHARARSPEMAALVDSLVAAVADHGGGIQMYFTHDCGGPCGSSEAAVARYEQRFVWIFQSVFSETVPRNVLAFDLSRSRPAAGVSFVEIASIVTSRGADADAQGVTMRFDVRVHASGVVEPKPFTLSMPPQKAPLTALRDHSIFAQAEAGGPESLVFARGFDRLYDELYGLFFAGAPRVPLHGSADERAADEELRESFGVPRDGNRDHAEGAAQRP